MTINELITALQRLEAESGSIVCLGCGYEHILHRGLRMKRREGADNG